MLEDNDFQDIVKDESEMYNDIEDIPIDSGDLAEQMMAVMKNPRVKSMVTTQSNQIGP